MTHIPDSWFDDWHSEGRYCMQSFADYCAEREANGGKALTNHSISKAVA